jgi:hypothetical protein
MKNQFGVSEVNAVMSERGITRKSAVRFLSRQPARKNRIQHRCRGTGEGFQEGRCTRCRENRPTRARRGPRACVCTNWPVAPTRIRSWQPTALRKPTDGPGHSEPSRFLWRRRKRPR